MANVSHASLTGSELHEPKGISGAAAGTVYVSNGAGTGTWSAVGTSSFTGMVADFVAPVAPIGWLELDGSVISTTTYAALYGVMSITTTGSRTNGAATVTSIPDTSNLKVGYYVFGTGIASGTTIISVDSSSQITLSANSSSTTSGSFVISPWLLNTGTIKLPDLTSTGRYRRSRSSTTKIGDVLANQNKSHTHTPGTITATTDSQGSHTHTASSTDSGHYHSYTGPLGSTRQDGTQAYTVNPATGGTTGIGYANITTTINANGAHTHNITASMGTLGSDGGSEARPDTVVMLTCVKT